MCVTDVPHFKEVILMSSTCETRLAAAMSAAKARGRRIAAAGLKPSVLRPTFPPMLRALKAAPSQRAIHFTVTPPAVANHPARYKLFPTTAIALTEVTVPIIVQETRIR
jgi:hypothetical protein